MRALLVVNPQATSTTAAGRDVLAHALASELKLDVLQTQYRGHAAEATASAVRAGVELVIAHGGDGTVNEVVNGLLEASPPCGDPHSGPQQPLLAVVPGGSANVFARALGLPKDPLEATSAVLRALAEQRSRTVGLGKADDRWFTFNAGLGWDADVVAAVERARAHGHEASPIRYARTALRHYLAQMRHPADLTVELVGEGTLSEVRLALICNTDPWTYLGSRPVRTNPGCNFADGLALFGLTSLSPSTVLPVLREILRKEGDPSGPNVLRRDKLPLIRVSSPTPVALQVDGDYLGERSEVEFLAVPSALRVVV
ncbi:diacylglycerol/lipid kinase family protein [Pseudonocardia spinosispora]|uniref:diacylglycerol/lipid kinase family protein n=1 Tax=Pseudonocardia spinosispora TaxID=103441 RepID=UPI0003FEAD18|nr:diacylglycerol kinase family protein [Pseudonocardia spinosispora]